jgi:hypothetical protein
VRELLDAFIAALPADLPAAAALQEFADIAFALPASPVGTVAGMKRFSGLFGRETSYLSLMRRPPWSSGVPD